MKEKDPIAVETGRLGGKKLFETHGSAHMSEIGKRGGAASPTKWKTGDPRASEAARLGGQASRGNFAMDKARAAEAGRKGAAARAANRAAAKEKPNG